MKDLEYKSILQQWKSDIKRKESKMSTENAGTGCLVMIFMLCIVASIGGPCFDYALYSFWGFNVPWYADALIGIPTVVPSVIAAVVCYILESQGYEFPLWPCKPSPETQPKT